MQFEIYKELITNYFAQKKIKNCIYQILFIYFIIIMSEEEQEIDQNQEQFKKLHFRIYKNKYPERDELVYVSII